MHVGLQWTLVKWHLPQDALGLALIVNALSDAHRDYLKAGGKGFIISDGQLRYAKEGIFELHYRLAIPGHLHCMVSFDY